MSSWVYVPGLGIYSTPEVDHVCKVITNNNYGAQWEGYAILLMTFRNPRMALKG